MKAIFQVFFKFIATTFFSISAIASHVELEKSAYNEFPNSLSGRDFFEKRSPPVSNETLKQRHFKAHAQSEVILSCRDNIAKVVCLVNPTTTEQDPQLRECLPGSQSYAIYFERLYDNYPPALQKMFCSLKHIFIEKHFFGTAYAGTLKDQNGAMMGIRQSVLDQNLNLTTWASWKEQLSFGGVADSYTPSPDLPHIETSSQTSTNDFLYFVVAHEF